jgi:hypothetical protein
VLLGAVPFCGTFGNAAAMAAAAGGAHIVCMAQFDGGRRRCSAKNETNPPRFALAKTAACSLSAYRAFFSSGHFVPPAAGTPDCWISDVRFWG